MPSLADIPSARSIKAIYAGNPGSGKTGSTIDIALKDPNAKLRYLDLDGNGGQILSSLARFDPKNGAPRDPALVARVLSQVSVHSLKDNIQSVNGQLMVTGVPRAFLDVGKLLNDWGEGDGGIASWDENYWLFIDSNTALGEAALRNSLQLASRLNRRPEQSDWGDAINRVGLLYENLTAPDIRCNVVIISHVRYLADREAGEDSKGKPREYDALPNALGQKMPQEIGRYFNNIWEARTEGVGAGMSRKIFTRPQGRLELKTSSPGTVKPSYAIDDFYSLVTDLRKGMGDTPPPSSPVTPTAPAAA